jgi:LysM repeat protein
MRRALAALVLAVALPLPGLADLVVQPGETLSEIAERNGVGLQQLMRLNGIQNPKLVQAGQRLVLPGAANTAATRSRGSRSNGGSAGNGGAGNGGTVVVQPGETLSEIAERNGIGLQQLMRLNGIQNPAMVEAGRRLVISGGSTAVGSGVRNSRSFSYTVKEGETLSELAERYDTTVQLLLQRNRIGSPSELQAGSQLLIPGNRPTTSSGPSSSGTASRAATSKPAAPAYNSKDREHVVQAGESLSQIAEVYKLPLDRLVVINNISNPDLMISGTRLKLTAPPPVNPAKSTGVASQASPKPAPAKPAGAKPSAKATTPAATAQSFPAAPTSKPRVAPQVVAAKPAAVQVNPSKPLTPSRAPGQTGPAQSGRSPSSPVASAPTSARTAARTAAMAAAAKPAANAATTAATATQTAAATSTAAAPTTNAPAMAGVRVARGSSAPGSAAIGNRAAGTAAGGTAPGLTPATSGAVATRALGGSKSQPSPMTPKSVGPDWRTYGPISVDWANWQSMGGSYVTPSLNGEGQPLYTAINCGARKLNATSQGGQWKTWDSPRNDAEQQLVDDLCKAKGS